MKGEESKLLLRFVKKRMGIWLEKYYLAQKERARNMLPKFGGDRTAGVARRKTGKSRKITATKISGFTALLIETG